MPTNSSNSHTSKPKGARVKEQGKPKRDFQERKSFSRDDSQGNKPKRDFKERRSFSKDDSQGNKPKRDFQERKSFSRDDSQGNKPKRDFQERKSFSRDDSQGNKPKRDFQERKSFSRDDSQGNKPKRDFQERKSFSRDDSQGNKPKRDFQERKSFSKDDSQGNKPKRDFKERRPFSRDDSQGNKPKRDFQERKSFSRDDSQGNKPKRDFKERRPFSRDDSQGNKPKRDFQERKSFSRDDSQGNKPKRDFQERRPFSRDDSQGNKPKRDFQERKSFSRDDSQGNKPKRDFKERRPFSRDDSQGNKPKRDFQERRPFSRDDSQGNKPKRDFQERRPFSKDDSQGNKPKRDFQERKPFAKDGKRFPQRRQFNQPRYNTRAVAAEALNQILYRGRLSEDALNSGFAKIPKEDIKLLHALCFGVLRWHGVLSKQALILIGKQQADLHSKVQLILELGIWQLSQGYAEHAAIHQCVEACEQVGLSRAKNFVNAILRKAQSAINDEGWKLDNQPYQFPKTLQGLLTADEFCQDPSLRLGAYTGQLIEKIQPVSQKIHDQLCQLQTIQPVISLRVQTNRIKTDQYQQQLATIGIKSDVGCYDNSLIIRQPIQVEKLPGYSVGAVVVQDMAAQCAAHILNPQPEMSVLDACAAPGGKSSHLQQLANNQLELIALEIDEYRSRRLRENFGRTRTNGKVVIGSAIYPSEWWHGRAFDLILADVPCSGTGVMRRHPDIPWLRKKEEMISQSAESLKMLYRLWSILKDEGKLLFATCSILPEENDFVIEQFLRQNNNAEKVEFDLPLSYLDTIHGKQIIPQHDNDSLYYCLLIKKKAIL